MRATCVALSLTAAACSLNKLTVDSTANVLAEASPSVERESDPQLVRDAFPAQLKMIEGFLEVVPDNPKLLALCAQASSTYAFAFLEDDMEEALLASQWERAEALRQRAREFHLRALGYGLRLLALSSDKFPAAYHGEVAGLERAVADLDDEEDVPGLFWTGFALGGALNVGKDQTWLLPALPKVEPLLMRAAALSDRYQNAGALAALGGYWGSRSPTFGGNAEKGRGYFEKAITYYPGFLMLKVMYARLYAVQYQDRALFEKLLREVLDADLATTMPEQRLANTLAQKRAARYLAQIDELVEPPLPPDAEATEPTN